MTARFPIYDGNPFSMLKMRDVRQCNGHFYLTIEYMTFYMCLLIRRHSSECKQATFLALSFFKLTVIMMTGTKKICHAPDVKNA